MYANLLMQLRHHDQVADHASGGGLFLQNQAGNGSSRSGSASPLPSSWSENKSVSGLMKPGSGTGCSSAADHAGGGLFLLNQVKLTAAARKEKLKSQLCFQCPVCKKRFQRHIAMNAHFQTEHVGSLTLTSTLTSAALNSKSHQKICKLCNFAANDMVAIRNHLLVKHNIDLETPIACLVEPEAGNGTSRSGSASPLPSSSSENKSVSGLMKPGSGTGCSSSYNCNNNDGITSTNNNNNVVVLEASAAAGYFVKQEFVMEDNIEEAKDLSIKKPMATSNGN
jgi:hypothetical protein